MPLLSDATLKRGLSDVASVLTRGVAVAEAVPEDLLYSVSGIVGGTGTVPDTHAQGIEFNLDVPITVYTFRVAIPLDVLGMHLSLWEVTGAVKLMGMDQDITGASFVDNEFALEEPLDLVTGKNYVMQLRWATEGGDHYWTSAPGPYNNNEVNYVQGRSGNVANNNVLVGGTSSTPRGYPDIGYVVT